jgi:capsular exopolysaccharide synthesis family protein
MLGRRSRRTDPIPVDEAFRVIRSNLVVSLTELEKPTVVVTSANAGEGKTATAVQLARSFARADYRVVLVDLDFRHPDAHNGFDAANEVGASDVLLRRVPLSEALQFVELPPRRGQTTGLYLLSTGAPVSDPTELLGSRRTSAMLEELASQADIVIIDTPPVLPVADTLVIGRMVAGAVLVIESRMSTTKAVQLAKDSLIRSQARLLGVVINKFESRYAEPGQMIGYGYGEVSDDGPGSDSPPPTNGDD